MFSRPALIGLLLATLTTFMASYAGGGESLVSLVLSAKDVKAVAVEDDTVWIKLTPVAAAELEEVTANNIGRRLRVRLDDIVATEMVVHAAIDAGVVQIKHPSAELTRVLKAIESKAAPEH